MHRLIKALLAAVGMGLLRKYQRLSFDLLKIQAASAYVKGVLIARRVWISVMLVSLALLLLAAGFVMVHVGFFLWVPWPPATKAVVLLLLGLLYMGVSLTLIFRGCSEKTWMEGSQADKLVEQVTRKK